MRLQDVRKYAMTASVLMLLLASTASCASPAPNEIPSPSESVQTELRILTGPYQAGVTEPLRTGIVLYADDDGCVVSGPKGSQLTLIWPTGFTVKGDRTHFEVLDDKGEVVAVSGVPFNVGGGGAQDGFGRDCVRQYSLAIDGKTQAP